MQPAWLAAPACLLWLGMLLLPWRPWSTRERLEASPSPPATDLNGITVLIPARNEAAAITRTLHSVRAQGNIHRVIVVDDQSIDDTADQALAAGLPNLTLLRGKAPPPGWTGKLWALEQGRREITTPYILLLDADMELQAGTMAAILEKMESEALHLVSLMAHLRMQRPWEKLLLPAFIYFFKLLYPFALSNTGSNYVRAAAGGCILVDTRILASAGGFAAIKGELIDDCALARLVHEHGGRTWTGLTHAAHSHRAYDSLGTIWGMVARTAYTQLRHSLPLLLFCTVAMLAAFVLPVAALFSPEPAGVSLAVFALVLMCSTYFPVLKYYNLNLLWSLLLPVTAVLYLLMTWSSAISHWRGSGAVWKDRSYPGRAGQA